MTPRSRLLPAVALAAFAVLASAVVVSTPARGAAVASPRSARAAVASVRVVVVGDIACDPASPEYNGGRGTKTLCKQRAVGRLAARLHPRYVITTGDNQYEDGHLSAYRTSYDSAFGALRSRTWPVPGNHEYRTPHAQGYLRYFGRRAGTVGHTWRARRPLAGWRVLLLDSDCWAIGGCGPGSPQHRWLVRQLRTSPSCTVAVWHHPFLTGGEYRGDADTHALATPLWTTAREGGVDLVLNGHDHNYQRFAPRQGMRELVVGTGGRSHYPVTTARGLQRSIDRTFGVLLLTLRADSSYRWSFHALGGRVLDSGTSTCANG